MSGTGREVSPHRYPGFYTRSVLSIDQGDSRRPLIARRGGRRLHHAPKAPARGFNIVFE